MPCLFTSSSKVEVEVDWLAEVAWANSACPWHPIHNFKSSILVNSAIQGAWSPRWTARQNILR